MTAISATEVRANFSEVLGRVAYGKERVIIERRGRPLAVLLPIEDLARLEAGLGGGPAGASHILNAVADNIPGTIYQRVQYPDGREEYSYISPGIRDTFGIEPEAMISDPATLGQAIHPEDRELRSRAIAESARTLSTYDVQYRMRTPAGETKWLHAIARPERRADGAIAWTGLTLDITKWKETEAALVESETRYRDIVENVADLIQSIGPDGRYLFVNQAWKDVLGYSDAEAKAMRFAEVLHPDCLAHCGEIFEGLGRGQSFENVSVVFVAKDGREIAVEGHLSSVLEAGQLVRTRAIFRDVTERGKAEQALRKSERRYHSLYDSIPLSVWEEDWSEVKKMIDRLAAEGVSDWQTYFESHGDEVKRAFDLCKTLNINPATREMYRAPNADNALDLILGSPVVEAELRKFASWLASFAEGHTTFVGESEEPRIDGSTFKARVRSCIPPEHADTWARVITTVEDVTDFNRTQQALRESDARLRDLIDGSIEGIMIHRDHKPLLVNEAWAAIHGYTVEEILGIGSVVDLISPADRERLIGYRDARLRGEEAPVRYEYRALRQDGSEIWLEHLVRTIDWEAAPAIQIVVIDITERKSAEAALERARDELERRVEERTQELHATNRALEEEIGTRKEVEERLSSFINNIPSSIYLKDMEGRYVLVNDSAVRQYGLPKNRLIGKTVYDIHPKVEADATVKQDREVLKQGVPIEAERELTFPDGSKHNIIAVKFPVRGESGEIIGIGGINIDVTERKRVEERLRQAQKMEAVGQLTGGVAHDFNNLLAVILGNAEMLGERLGTEDRQVAAVMRAAARGAELTQRLLAFSRRQPLKPQAIDLAGRVAGMTELLTRTLGATIEITVASAPGLWRASADPGQLENALLNLAINARDAMPEGGRLSISSANASLEAGEIAALLAGQAPEAADGEPGGPGGPGDYVVLSVSDTGTGMSPAVLARVFEPFFTTKDVGQGSGLGLSMVYGFARQSGGFAAIESAPGRGTTVRLYLPRAVAATPEPGARSRATQLPRGHETVLLLEDAQDMRELAVALLEDLGYHVLAAADAAEAGARLAENPGVDLLLADVILPGGRSGPDFAETARRRNPALKVLFMSGYSAEVLMQRGDSLARDTPLLPKPFRKTALAKAVREALDDGTEVQGAE